MEQNLHLKKIYSASSICIPSSVYRARYSPHIPLLQPTFFNNEEAEGCEEGFKTKETWFYRLDMPEGYKHFSKTKPMKVEHTLPIQEWWKDRKEIISDEVGEKSRVFTAQQLIDLDCNFDQCKFPKEEEEILPPAELLKQYFEKRTALDHEIDKTLSEIQKILGIDIKSCN